MGSELIGTPTERSRHAPNVVRILRKASHVGSMTCVAVGLIVLLGWVFGVVAITNVSPTLAPMKPNTAIGFALIGASLWLRLRADDTRDAERAERQARQARIPALLVTLLSALTLLQYASGWNLHVDDLFFEHVVAPAVQPGRMSPATALNLGLLGLALLLLDVRVGPRKGVPSQWLALVTALSAMLSLLGYAYGVQSLYAMGPFVSIALHTAIVHLVAAMAILFARPESGIMRFVVNDSPAGAVARRLLPAGILLPSIFGWLRVAGQEAGYYQLGFGTALFALANIVCFTALIWWSSGVLFGADGARRHAETTLRESEEDLRITLDSMGDGFIATDTTGRIVRMNPVAEKLTGWRFIEAKGRAIGEVFDVRDETTRELVELAIERVLRDGVIAPSSPTAIVARDSVERSIAYSGAPILDARGNARGVALVFRDQTEERRAMRALRDNEALKTAMLEAALDGIILMNHEGTITEFNPAAETTFGYTRAEVVGKSLGEMLIPPSLRRRHDAGLQRFLETGQARVLGQRIEVTAKKADGTEFPAEVAVVRIRSEGTPLFTGYVRDITERRRAAEAELLRKAKEAAEAANAELEAFSYSVAHDLRAPLRGINGFSAALLEDHGHTFDDDAKAQFRRITAASERMGHIIDGLLGLARLTRTELRRERVNLSQLATSVMDQIRAADADRALDFIVADDALDDGDPRLLRSLFENLLGNAWKFTRERKVARIEFGRLESDAESAATYFVRDNGAGFSMAYVDKLFAPFGRLHAVDRFAGTGIGLATVHRIVRRHAGRVWAEGVEGEGATFYFTLSGAGGGSGVSDVNGTSRTLAG